MRIQTIDADSFPLAGGRARRARVRDDVLEGNEPRKRISRGLVYVGGALYPIHDVGPDDVEALEAGKNFVLGEPIEAEDIAEYLARHAKDQLGGTRPSGLIAKTFVRGADTDKRARDDDEINTPSHERGEPAGPCFPNKTGDARSRPVLDYRMIRPGSARGISTADYQKNLIEGRKEQAAAAPAKVTTAADYAATLAAGRAAKARQ